MSSSIMLQYSPVRWKEWIPLTTQQQRLRNLIQIIGYNINACEKKENVKKAYYYTLHLTNMCAPFYTSEKISKEHPKWSEINFLMIDPSYGSATGIVVRIWEHHKEVDSIVTVWGVYFSGLSYIGPHIISEEQTAFSKNTLVFCMHGGYFTSPDCVVNDEPTLARITAMSLNLNDVRKSYTIDALSRLHSIQRSMKELTEESVLLRNKILAGEFYDDKSEIRESSAFLRKLLNQSKPVKVPHEKILAFKRNVEATKFRVQLLHEAKSNKLSELRKLTSVRNGIQQSNREQGCELTNRTHTLYNDMHHLKEWEKAFSDGKDNLFTAKNQFSFRQKQLISELAYIYPIKVLNNKYTICDVHLPNSEDFDGTDELSLSVALGFTAHLVQMISFIISIPLRYPVMHFGSRSKIVDHIADQLPEKNRGFPLFARSKDKLQFNYAVYLLNKNIAQLRWYCGIVTTDLRATLPNVESLLNMHTRQRTVSAENKYTSDNLARLSSFSRNTLRYGSIPSRFNQRKPDRLSCSLDGGLDKWQDEKTVRNDIAAGSTQNVSELVSRDDGQTSSDSEYAHKAYVSAIHSDSVRLQSTSEEENAISEKKYR